VPAYAFGDVIPVVSPDAFVHPQASLIGDVVIGSGCYVGPFASLRGDLGRIELEDGSNVQDNCVLHCFPGQSTVVERDGHIGHGVVLHGCRIGRGALVGMNAVVMDGARVGVQAFVAAQSLVASDMVVPDRWLAAGLPAKPKRPLTDAEIAWKANGTRVYQELARRCRTELREVSPLASMEPIRPSLSLAGEVAVPLRAFRQATKSGERRETEVT
jgi:phenylacetic acid degradation protein